MCKIVMSRSKYKNASNPFARVRKLIIIPFGGGGGAMFVLINFSFIFFLKRCIYRFIHCRFIHRLEVRENQYF